MTIVHNHDGPRIELERTLPSEEAAISPFADKLLLLLRKCGCVSESEVEIALGEALPDAISHRNHENQGKQVYVRCRSCALSHAEAEAQERAPVYQGR